jgi:predicted nucleic-acid-binding Zn-ribbon protein
MLDEKIQKLNANDLRALIERAKLSDIVYDILGGSEECLKCGNKSFELDGEVLVNFNQPFLSNNRIDVLKSTASSKKNYADARITCAKCGFVYQVRFNMSESKEAKL